MKRILSTLLLSVIYISGSFIHAQDESEQLLIFRNTGEVNLLYSSKVDSIVCSIYDKDSIMHNEYVSQVFYGQDTILVVPIAEIDSVAFGPRNIVEYKDDVRQLTTSDLPYIIRYDGNIIYYRTNTPTNILPSIGEKLFYGEMDSIFPIGLCAKVTGIEKSASEIMVSVTDVELSEVFEKLFYAGRAQADNASLSRNNVTRSTHSFEIPCKINFCDMGSIAVNGRTIIDAAFVVHPLQHYYHGDFTINTSFGLDAQVMVVDKAEISIDDEFKTFHFPNIAQVLHPQLTIGAFAELNAELAFNYSMNRTYCHKWEWTRQNGTDTFVNHGSNDAATPEDKAEMDITCNGELYFGPMFIVEFNTLLSTVGARVKTKLGPSVKSEIGLKQIQALSKEYDPELYSQAELEVKSKLDIGGYTFTRNIFTGEETEYLLMRSSHSWAQMTFPYFPDFEVTRAVEMQQNNGNVSISTATKSNNEIIRDVETGFQIENENTNEILSIAFVDTITAENNTTQGVSAEFEIPNALYVPKKTIARPVFRYANHIIKADKARVLTDNHLQPIITMMADGVNCIVSGYPMVGSTVKDGIYYNVGNYMPVVTYDKAFGAITTPVHGIYITLEEVETLLGTWKGEINGNITSLTFNADSTGIFHKDVSIPFEYRTNYPQSGDIILMLDNSTTMAFVLHSLTNNELILKKKEEETYYTFTKQ